MSATTAAVVNTATMRVTDSLSDSKYKFFLGIAAIEDPAKPSQTLVVASGGGNDVIYFFRLDAGGKLHEDGSPLQTLPPAAQDTPGARALGGSFASASLPNTLLGYLLTQTEPLIEGCCSGSGARALHLAWEHAVEDRAGGR